MTTLDKNTLAQLKAIMAKPTLTHLDFQAGYKLVLDAISHIVTNFDTGVPHLEPNLGVDRAVWTWITGAQKVNENSGTFANYIRDYTAMQYQIRSSVSVPSDVIKSKIDTASDQIANAFLFDVINHNGLIPSLSQVGAYDAAGAAANVFIGSASVLGLPNFSPWAGTVLFANLGDAHFFQDWIATAVHDGKQESGVYDLIASAQVTTTLKTTGLALKTILTGDISTFIDLQALGGTAVTTAINSGNAFFKQEYGNDITFVSPGNSIFGTLTGSVESASTYHVGTVGSDATLHVVAGNVVVNGGAGDDAILVDYSQYNGGRVIDGSDGDDSVSYQAYTNVNLNFSTDAAGAFGGRIVVKIPGTSSGDNIYNVEHLTLGGGNDVGTINPANVSGLKSIDLGAGNDNLQITASASTNAFSIYGGDGNDSIYQSAYHSTEYHGARI